MRLSGNNEDEWSVHVGSVSSWTTGPSHELFCVLPKALEKFDQHAPFLSAQRFPNVFHDRCVFPKCFLDKLPPRCSEADYTVSPIRRMCVTPD